MSEEMGSDAYMQPIHAANAGSNQTADVGPEALCRLDLNLLVAFDAMARERSVTAAAARVGVTQSAMSHALRRLRVLFDDPLLVRGQSGMLLTPRAEALVVPLRSGLVTLGRALSTPQRFDPHTASRGFHIATPDLFDVLVIPALLEHVRRTAPGIDLTVLPVATPRLSERLETGELDATIVPQMDETRAGTATVAETGLVRRVIGRDDFVCLMRADHPALRGPRGGRRAAAKGGELSLETYAELSHLVVSQGSGGRSVIDELLERRGLVRRIALRIPHFYSALAIVSRSDLILTAPTALARVAQPSDSIVALPPPLRIPGHALVMTWHERFANDPGQLWLRETIATTTQAVLSKAGVRSRA